MTPGTKVVRSSSDNGLGGQQRILKGYAYAWITLGFFLNSLLLHWWFGWYAT